MTASPFDWLEASYFYYRPSDLVWGSTKGLYLDKGFNVKFLYKSKYKNLPKIAIGLDDFAGTGLFSREYIVSTKELRRIKLSLGIGWGKLAGNNGYKNPLSYISNEFNYRGARSGNYKLGGSLAYDHWFSGNASVFGGLEFYIPKSNGLKFKLEYDPSNYIGDNAMAVSPFNIGASDVLRKQDSNFNYGLSYPVNKYLTINTSFIKGNTFNVTFNIAVTFDNKLSKKNKFNPVIKNNPNINKSKLLFYEDLLYNLNNNKLLLQTASLEDKKLEISISTPDHRSAIRSSSYAAHIAKSVSEAHEIDTTSIEISHINAGIELNQIRYISNYIMNNKIPVENIRSTTNLDSGDMGYKRHEFQPKVNFPVIFSSFNPTIISHIGSPQRVYYGGLALQNINEIQFSRNLLLSTEINYALSNNFDTIVSIPDSLLPHVRTDVVRYLQDSDLQISRMQLDYLWSPYKNTYAKLSAGLFESMYGGIGAEILYKPFNKKYMIGLESFYVKKREFNQKFDFRNYHTTTSHISLIYNFPLRIQSNLSYGRYLAKDDGFTLDLSRTTKSGFKAGIYFTNTNVSAELFGEGSFDKGFYFDIPMDLFSSNYRGGYSSFKLSPLTRDGGAKLKFAKDLKSMIFNSTLAEISGGWNGFNN